MEILSGILGILFFASLIASIVFLIMGIKKKMPFKKFWISLIVMIVSFLCFEIFGDSTKQETLFIDLNKSTVTLNKKGNAVIKMKTNAHAKYEGLDADNNDKKLFGPANTKKGNITLTVSGKGNYKIKVQKDGKTKTKIFHVKPYKLSKKESISSSVAAASAKSSSKAAASSESVAEASSKVASSAAKASSESAAKNPDTYNSGITYDQVARTPKDYKGKNIEFTGEVAQVIEDGGVSELRLAVNGNYDDIILVDVPKKVLNGSRVLENDLITVGGTSVGTVSYKSTLGAKITVPAMVAFALNDKGTASDDYGE